MLKVVVPIQHGLGDAPPIMLLVQPVSEKRDVALRNHMCRIASSSPIPILSCKYLRARKGPDFGSLG
jgi:hypothetical protein